MRRLVFGRHVFFIIKQVVLLKDFDFFPSALCVSYLSIYMKGDQRVSKWIILFLKLVDYAFHIIYLYNAFIYIYIIHIISNMLYILYQISIYLAQKKHRDGCEVFAEKNVFKLTFNGKKNTLTRKKQSHRGVLPEEGVLRMCCRFSGAYLCVDVVLTMLQSDFVEIALLYCCSPVGLLHICRASFLENTSGGLLLNKDNFI